MLLVASIAAAPAAPVSIVAPDDAPSLVDDLAIGELPPREQAMVDGTGQDAGVSGPPDGCTERTPHPPIRITEDHGPQGYTWTDPVTGEREPRPGSGVIAGSGTPDDPYVIAGWCILVPSHAPEGETPSRGIQIQGTGTHVVLRDNAVLGPTRRGTGILVDAANNVTVAENRVHDAASGIVLRGGTGPLGARPGLNTNLTATGNTLTGHAGSGIVVAWLAGAVVDNNTIHGNRQRGIFLMGADDTTIADNVVAGHPRGILVGASHGVTVRDNEAEGNAVDLFLQTASHARILGNVFETGVVVWGIAASNYVHEVDGNTVQSQPLVYLGGDVAATIPDEVGQIVVGNATNVTVDGVEISGTAAAIQVGFTDHVRITNTTLEDNRDGIRVQSGWPDLKTDTAIIRNNTVIGSAGDGIAIRSLWEGGAEVVANEVTGSGTGVNLASADGATVRDNEISGNDQGIRAWPTDDARVVGNAVTGNEEGILVDESEGVNVSHNDIVANRDGLVVRSSSGVAILANRIATNENRGILLDASPPDFGSPDHLAIHGNNLVGNGVGLWSRDSEAVAWNNWWDDPSGPSGVAWDPCEVAPATGQGGTLVVQSGVVCFHPWLEEPNQQAGAG